MSGARGEAAQVGAAIAVFLSANQELRDARRAVINAVRERRNAETALCDLLPDRGRVFIGGKLITRIGGTIHVEHGVRAL